MNKLVGSATTNTAKFVGAHHNKWALIQVGVLIIIFVGAVFFPTLPESSQTAALTVFAGALHYSIVGLEYAFSGINAIAGVTGPLVLLLDVFVGAIALWILLLVIRLLVGLVRR